MLKLIACNVFWREACLAIAESPHVIDADFTEVGEHIHCDSLRSIIQAKIDTADESGRNYDAIVLLYGLCGNAGVGLRSRSSPLIMPRAHDCCTILLGSKTRFHELFGDNPSTPFSSTGYMERGNYFMRVDEDGSSILYGDEYASYVERYGEERGISEIPSIRNETARQTTVRSLSTFPKRPISAMPGNSGRKPKLKERPLCGSRAVCG